MLVMFGRQRLNLIFFQWWCNALFRKKTQYKKIGGTECINHAAYPSGYLANCPYGRLPRGPSFLFKLQPVMLPFAWLSYLLSLLSSLCFSFTSVTCLFSLFVVFSVFSLKTQQLSPLSEVLFCCVSFFTHNYPLAGYTTLFWVNNPLLGKLW